MRTNAGRKRCCSCSTVLTSEDQHRFGVSCEICEEDIWYYEHLDYLPIHAAWRYTCYQLRWLWHTAGYGRDICLRPLLRRLDARRQHQNARRGR